MDLDGVIGEEIWRAGKGGPGGKGTGRAPPGYFAGCRLQPIARSQWYLQARLPHLALTRVLLQPSTEHECLLADVAGGLPVICGCEMGKGMV